MKKLIGICSALIAAILLIVSFLAYSYYPLWKTADRLKDMKYSDYTIDVSVDFKSDDNTFLSLLGENRFMISGNYSDGVIYGSIALPDDTVPFVDGYLDQEKNVTVNVGQVLNYLLQKIKQKSGASVAAILSLINVDASCYITDAQFKDITGVQMIPDMSSVQGKDVRMSILTFRKREMPEDSGYSDSFGKMTFYKGTLPNGEAITVGCDTKQKDALCLYIKSVINHHPLEGIVTLKKAKHEELIEIPESDVSDFQIELYKSIFEKIKQYVGA